MATRGQREAQGSFTHTELMTKLDIYSEPRDARSTHIVCTLGPSSREVPILKDLINAGLGIARMNFSHGDHEYHGGTIANVRTAAEELGHDIAIALDTKGPEIRTGLLKGADADPRLELDLKSGESITVTTDDKFKAECTKETLWLDYKNIVNVMVPGNHIFLDDGLISLKVESIDKAAGSMKCTVINSGNLGSRKGCNLPEVPVDLPALSEKDKKDLKFGVEQGVDIVFASFIRKPKDLADIREVLGDAGKNIKIISKIENHEGVQNFDAILEHSDGIMVARGDLGIEIPAEKVFLAQKMMISKCNIVGKPVICATQMLESMTKNPRPTRAEGSDVANAVLDGADCVMLSGETAKGKFPVKAVSVMAAICQEAEGAFFYRQVREDLSLLSRGAIGSSEACAKAAVQLAIDSACKAIITFTTTGTTAVQLSKWRSVCPVFAITRVGQTARQLQLHRGVHPFFYKDQKSESDSWSDDVEKRVQWGIAKGKALGIVSAGDSVVVVHGWAGGPGRTNTVRSIVVE